MINVPVVEESHELRSAQTLALNDLAGLICHANSNTFLASVEAGRYKAEALKRPGAKPMDITGRPMKGFIWVDAGRAEGADLRGWIDFAASFVRTLPAKVK